MKRIKLYKTFLAICSALFVATTAFTLSLDRQLIQDEIDLRLEAQEIAETVRYTTVIIQTSPFAAKEDPEPAVKSAYDELSEFEISLIETTIQHEVGTFSYEYKKLIAELIYNRVKSDSFPDTVEEVLFQSGQFQQIEPWYYSGIVPDEDTKRAVRDAFESEIPSHSCLYYYNPKLSSQSAVVWFEYSGDVEYVFSWTERDWGIDYETRFFR